MSDSIAAVIAELEAAASATWREEEALRTRMAQEVALLERRRAFAFRRSSLVRILSAAAARAETDELAAAAQRSALAREFDWDSDNEFRLAVFDRLRPVGRMVWQITRGDPDAGPPAMHTELEAFEAWYSSKHGEPFYALFDREAAQVALVET